MAPDKIEAKKQIFSKYQLMIADFYNIPIRNVKKLVSNSFGKEKNVLHLENLTILKIKFKAKINTSCIRIQSITMA